jgi:RNA polymerase sigma-70 factor, ECF subfamily
VKSAVAFQQKFFVKSKAGKEAKDFTNLYHQHNSLVRGVIYQVLGAQVTQQALNDLVQDAFVKIWNGLPDFREDAQLKSWVYRISVNTALDSTRTAAFKREVFDFDFQLLVDPRANSEEEVSNRNLVAKGLQELSEDIELRSSCFD